MSEHPIMPRLADIIPREVLQQPFPERAFYDNVTRFVLFGAPVGLGVALSVGGFVAFWSVPWAAVTFGLIGMCLVCIIYILYNGYSKTANDLTSRRTTHDTIILNVVALIQTITVNQTINVKSGGILNTGASTMPDVAIPEAGIDPINETYDLALKITRIAIESYKDGKRPKPKPFSAQLITEEFHVGREKWMEAIQMISDAGVLLHPDRAVWTPLVKTLQEGEGKLKKFVETQNFFRDVKKEIWVRK